MSQKTDLSPTIEFLQKLVKNNNREWFKDNRALYERSHKNIIEFADRLLELMQKHDHIETPSGKKSLFRIYRDTRFSKDKTPYKDNWGGGFRRATQELRGGYYFQVQPGNSFIAGGFWGPNPQDLLHIRKQIAQDPEPLRAILDSKTFKDYFSELGGDRVKTAPKGFSKEDPAIDLLRHKQFVVRHYFTDKEVLHHDFLSKVSSGFQQMRPFFDCMSEILTTDLNGTPLFDS